MPLGMVPEEGAVNLNPVVADLVITQVRIRIRNFCQKTKY